MSDRIPEPIYIAGQTAIGKSAVALHLAEQLNGEIITVDSMQVYQGMDIGTAKPSKAEQARVPHHLLDVAVLSETFDAARFSEEAREAERAIRKRGHTPIFCGGTGLYFKAHLCGLGTAPPSDAQLRAQLESTPLPDLLQELGQCDPETFHSIDRDNPRRVVRALEVIRLTGAPLSVQQADWNRQHSVPNLFALSREPGDLRRRIEHRVDQMFDRGLVVETEELLGQGLADNRTALQALGYRQVSEHLQGKRSLEETIQLVKVRTWQFARRQKTWFRRQLRAQWIHIPPEETPSRTADRILERMRKARSAATPPSP